MANLNNKLKFSCPECDHVIRTTAKNAGKKGRCPKCKSGLRIPLVGTAGPEEDEVVDQRLATEGEQSSLQKNSGKGVMESASDDGGSLDFNFDDIDEIISREKGETTSDVESSHIADLAFVANSAFEDLSDSLGMTDPGSPVAEPAQPGTENVSNKNREAGKVKSGKAESTTPRSAKRSKFHAGKTNPVEVQPVKPKSAKSKSAKSKSAKPQSTTQPDIPVVPDDLQPSTDPLKIPFPAANDPSKPPTSLSEPIFQSETLGEDDLLFESENAPALDGVPLDLPAEDLPPIGIHEAEKLKVDFDEVFGMGCHICDTRIHVTPAQVGQEVECPICYTKVLVKDPKGPAISTWELGGKNRDTISTQFGEGAEQALDRQNAKSDDDELTLADPVDRPQSDLVEIPENFGFDNVSDDLLSPMRPPPPDGMADEIHDEFDDDDPPLLEVIDDGSSTANDPTAGTQPFVIPDSPVRPAVVRKPEVAETGHSEKRRPAAADSGSSAAKTSDRTSARQTPGAKSAKKRSRRQKYEQAHFDEIHDESDRVRPVEIDRRPIQLGILVQTGMGFVASSFVQLMPAIIALGTGGILWDTFRTLPEAPFGERTFMFILQVGLGGTFWLIGTGILMYISGVVFRHAAMGHKEVKQWKPPTFGEIRDTILLFSISFLAPGIPFLLLSWIATAIRFLVSPVFLVSAWFNQSAFSVLSTDVFKYAARDKKEWMVYYLFVGLLALFSMISGLMFWSSIGILAIFAAPIYGVLVVVFAAATGWHAGRVIDRFEHGPSADLETDSESVANVGPTFESEMDN